MNYTLFYDHYANNSTTFAIYSIGFSVIFIIRNVLIIYMIFGIVGNVFNILIFTHKDIIRTSASIYLLSTSIANLLVVILIIPYHLFADGFQLDLSLISIVSCRIVSYFYHIFLTLPPLFTVLACADRWAASCTQVNRRRFASVHIANRLIPLTIIFCCLIYSYIPFTYTNDIKPPPPFCSSSDSYAIFVLSFRLIIYSLVPPWLMAVFSLKIIFNVRRRPVRLVSVNHVITLPVNGNVLRRNRHRLSQMQIMLVCQSIIECVLSLPFSTINLISIVAKNDENFLGIYSLVRLFIFFNCVSSFYIYTISSKLYRNEFKKILKRLFNRN